MQPGLETNDTTITYIPFLRDSQNYVNASLLIATTGGDTLMGYVCDWQYANMTFGGTQADSSAENLASFFMFFTKQTLGISKFKITDTALFASHPRLHSEDQLELTFLDPNPSGNLIETNTNQICYPSYFCGAPNSPECANGCDYLNCSNPPHCHATLICFTFPGGDPGSGVLLDPPGGGGSGGGGGTGSGTPPGCVSGPTTPGTIFTDIDYTCGPGWVPVPIDDDEPIPEALLQQWDDSIIIDPTVRPCNTEIIDSIKKIERGAIAKMIYTMSLQIPAFNWEIREVAQFVPPENPTASAITSINNFNSFATTRLNTSILGNATNASVARTILHEAVHAYIQNYVVNNNLLTQSQKDSIKALSFAKKLKTYMKIIYNNHSNSFHNNMARDFVYDIKLALKDLCPKLGINLSPNDLETFCNDMAWGGLQDEADDSPWMDPSLLSDEDRARIIKRLQVEANNLPGFSGFVMSGGTNYHVSILRIGTKTCP